MRRGRRCVRALGSEQVGSHAAQGRTIRRADSKWTHSVPTGMHLLEYLTLFVWALRDLDVRTAGSGATADLRGWVGRFG